MTYQIDRNNLSKYKYIYCMYCGEDGYIYYERFPIAYINGIYTYYITGKQELLKSVHTESISSTFAERFENADLNKVIYLLRNGQRYYAFNSIGSDIISAQLKNSLDKISKLEVLKERVKNIDIIIKWTSGSIVDHNRALAELQTTIDGMNAEKEEIQQKINAIEANLKEEQK